MKFDQDSVLKFVFFEFEDINFGSSHGHSNSLTESLIGVFLISLQVLDSDEVVFAKNDIVEDRVLIKVAVVEGAFLQFVLRSDEGGFVVRGPDIFAFRYEEFFKVTHLLLANLCIVFKA